MLHDTKAPPAGPAAAADQYDMIPREKLRGLLVAMLRQALEEWAGQVPLKSSITAGEAVLIAIGYLHIAEVMRRFPDLITPEELAEPAVAYLRAMEFMEAVNGPPVDGQPFDGFSEITRHVRESLRNMLERRDGQIDA